MKAGSSTARPATAAPNDLEKIEAEYIKNLQQQVYFLELEANFLYPFLKMAVIKSWNTRNVTLVS